MVEDDQLTVLFFTIRSLLFASALLSLNWIMSPVMLSTQSKEGNWLAARDQLTAKLFTI